jgi:hypothetical protein
MCLVMKNTVILLFTVNIVNKSLLQSTYLYLSVQHYDNNSIVIRKKQTRNERFAFAFFQFELVIFLYPSMVEYEGYNQC